MFTIMAKTSNSFTEMYISNDPFLHYYYTGSVEYFKISIPILGNCYIYYCFTEICDERCVMYITG